MLPSLHDTLRTVEACRAARYEDAADSPELSPVRCNECGEHVEAEFADDIVAWAHEWRRVGTRTREVEVRFGLCKACRKAAAVNDPDRCCLCGDDLCEGDYCERCGGGQ